jgi:hypothetical protein
MEELECLRVEEGRLRKAISNCVAQPFSGAKWKRCQDLQQELEVLLHRQAKVEEEQRVERVRKDAVASRFIVSTWIIYDDV